MKDSLVIAIGVPEESVGMRRLGECLLHRRDQLLRRFICAFNRAARFLLAFAFTSFLFVQQLLRVGCERFEKRESDVELSSIDKLVYNPVRDNEALCSQQLHSQIGYPKT